MLESIDYKKIFTYFEEISQIPRGSGNNQKISDYLVSFAKKHGLSYIQDEALNVVIKKEASKGYENAPTVMLQGHMDMVCEKESQTEHDFTKEGLMLQIKGDYILADGTTLGGDDGIAIAYALAILENNSIAHPALEVVITTDEEVGMGGAMALDCSNLKSKYLLNLDSEEEGVVLTSCAGGMTVTCKIFLQYEEIKGNQIDIQIKGLQGGHSGTEIDKNRTNANVLMGRLLNQLEEKYKDYHLVSISGGSKDNAIPRESNAKIQVETEESYLLKELETLIQMYKKELQVSEPYLEIELTSLGSVNSTVLTKETKKKILSYMMLTPNGVQVMSSAISGLVESSLNLGILKMNKEAISFSYSVRSSVGSYKEFISTKLKDLVELFDGDYKIRGEYPAWEYNPNSKLRQICTEAYKELFQKEMAVEAIHAGLECGLLSDKIKDLDIISIGPDILDIHTPKEQLCISSAKRCFDLVLRILEKIKE